MARETAPYIGYYQMPPNRRQMDTGYRAATPGYPEHAYAAREDLWPTPLDFLSNTMIPGVADAADAALLYKQARDEGLSPGLLGMGAAALLPGVGAGMVKKVTDKFNVSDQVFGDGRFAGYEIMDDPDDPGIVVTTGVDPEEGTINTYLENYKENNAGTGNATKMTLTGMLKGAEKGFDYHSDSILSDEMQRIYDRLIRFGVPLKLDEHGRYAGESKKLNKVTYDEVVNRMNEHYSKQR